MRCCMRPARCQVAAGEGRMEASVQRQGGAHPGGRPKLAGGANQEATVFLANFGSDPDFCAGMVRKMHRLLASRLSLFVSLAHSGRESGVTYCSCKPLKTSLVTSGSREL